MTGTVYVQPREVVTPHFWHFVIGELFVALFVAINRRAKRLVICAPGRKWGRCPLDRFYQEISSDVLEVRTRSSLPGGKKRVVKLSDPRFMWDTRHESGIAHSAASRAKLRRVLAFVSKLARSKGYGLGKGCDVLFQLRRDDPALAWYHARVGPPPLRIRPGLDTSRPGVKRRMRRQKRLRKRSAEAVSYGSRRRSYQGLAELEKWAEARGISAELVGGDGSGFFEQLAPYMTARRLVWGHGGGMVWALFLPTGAEGLEFRPEEKSAMYAECIAKTTGVGITSVVAPETASAEELARVLEGKLGLLSKHQCKRPANTH